MSCTSHLGNSKSLVDLYIIQGLTAHAYTEMHIHIPMCMQRVFSPDFTANKSKDRFVSAPGGARRVHHGKACGFFRAV